MNILQSVFYNEPLDKSTFASIQVKKDFHFEISQMQYRRV